MLDKVVMGKLNRLCRCHGWEVDFSPLSVVGSFGENPTALEITVDGSFLGKANLRLIDPSKRDQLEIVKDIVSMFLQPKLYKQYLDAKEQEAKSEISRAFNLRDLSVIEDESLLEEKIANFVFEIRESTTYSSRRFADDIHELKSNWAFIDQDIIPVTEANELIKLGPVTWYIANPTSKEMAIVEEYLSKKAEINEWATIVFGKTGTENKMIRQQVDLKAMPLQPGLRKDVLRLLVGVS